MFNRSTPIAETSLRGLHPRSIADTDEIRRLLDRAVDAIFELERGTKEPLNENGHAPIWTRDGSRMSFKSGEGIYSKSVALDGERELL